MQFSLKQSLEILERTPFVIEVLLKNLSEDWTMNNEGPNTWSAFDVLGHLIHGEKTDWIPRMEIILSNREDKTFNPFDMKAHFKASDGKSLQQLLDEFKSLRSKNIDQLQSKKLTESDLNKKGIHPEFGEVTLREMLSTWVVHDLNHIAQISRVMGKQYESEVGPWKNYLGILK
jgi:uncharacterized damage-inducible protein DinB